MANSRNFPWLATKLPWRQRLEQRHRILLRDCRSFEGLDGSWLRIGLQNRRRHRQLLRALEQAQADGAF